MPRSQNPSPLWTLVALDAVTVAGVIALHLLFGQEVPTSVHVGEALAIGAVGIFFGGLWWRAFGRLAGKESSGTGADSGNANADLAVLRKETLENLRLLQQDLHGLGQAVMKRLAAQTKPEIEHFEAIAGTITDLAISLAEARESLGHIAGDIAETKSTIFEIQAQVDQQADALHAFEHALGRTPDAGHDDAGEGAAPGSLGKALTCGVAGGAVARLIGNGGQKTGANAPVPEEVAPLASTDIEGSYESEGQPIPAVDFSVDPVTESEWDDAELTAPFPADAAPAPEPLVTADDEELPVVDEDEESEDWITGGLDEEEALAPVAPAALQPDLLSLDEDSAGNRKPRRPGRNDTALIAHVMIGIGNKPYLRGHGPGLSTEKGVPMEYVDVGRWQWICPEAGSPLSVTLWKNDEVPAEGGAVGVPSGMTLEIHPQFSH